MSTPSKGTAASVATQRVVIVNGNSEMLELLAPVLEMFWRWQASRGSEPTSVGKMAIGATVLANLSASNVTVGKAEYRRLLCAGQSGRSIAGYLYVGAGPGACAACAAVLVMAIGSDTSPDSSIHTQPVISPLPLSE